MVSERTPGLDGQKDLSNGAEAQPAVEKIIVEGGNEAHLTRRPDGTMGYVEVTPTGDVVTSLELDAAEAAAYSQQLDEHKRMHPEPAEGESEPVKTETITVSGDEPATPGEPITVRGPALTRAERRRFNGAYNRLSESLGLNDTNETATASTSTAEAGAGVSDATVSDEASVGQDEDDRLAAIIAKGKAAEAEGGQDDHVEPAVPEARPSKADLEAAWMQKVQEYRKLGAKDSDKGRQLRREVDEAYDALHAPETRSVDTLHDEWMALVGQYGNMGDRNSEAGRELKQQIDEAYLQLRIAEAEAAKAEADAAAGVGEDKPAAGEEEPPVEPSPTEPELEPKEPEDTPITDVFRAAQAAALERRRLAEERQASISGVETAFINNPENRSVIDGLKLAQDRYTRLKAKSETWGKWGRRKREVELNEAEQALKNAELAYAKSMTDAKAAAGLLESEDPAERRYLHGEEMFGTLRGLINNRRTNVKDFRTEKIENPNLAMRVLGAVGRFVNSGGKWAKRLKAGGAGVVAGVSTVLSGVAWPVTMAASIGGGLLVRGGSIVDTLKKQMADIGVEDKDGAIITDDMFAAFMESFRQSSSAWQDVAENLAQESLDVSRAQGYRDADAARTEGRRAMTRYGVGFAIGSAATLITSGILNTVHASGNTVTAHPNEGTLPNDRYPTLPTHEFAHGADRITSGEGWFHQFMDMGMSNKEAHALFADDKVMKKLVDAGAAYVDNSARIGGYGINMPKGGHLSAKAMEIIGNAMNAKGY